MSTTASDALSLVEHGDRFLVQQVFKPLANEYRISVPAHGDARRATRSSSSSRRR